MTYAPIGDPRHGRSTSDAPKSGPSAHEEANGSKKKHRRRKQTGADMSSWLDWCEVDAKGRPIPNLANAMIALRSDPAVKDAFAFNEMLCTAMLVRPISNLMSEFKPRPLTDVDVPVCRSGYSSKVCR